MALRVGRNNEKKKSRIVIAIIRVKRTKINKNKYRKRKGRVGCVQRTMRGERFPRRGGVITWRARCARGRQQVEVPSFRVLLPRRIGGMRVYTLLGIRDRSEGEEIIIWHYCTAYGSL